MFKNSPSQKSDVFDLVIEDVSGIGQVLDYMYTSHLDINQENVQALLNIAQCLQIPNVQSMCNAFLKPCPPPADTPSFPLLSSEHDCLLGGGLPLHHVDLHCPTSDAQRTGCSNNSDPKRLHVPDRQSNSNGETAASTHAPVEKQLVHGYKLRNFYSKQYFKESAAQNNSVASSQGPSPLLEVGDQQHSHPFVMNQGTQGPPLAGPQNLPLTGPQGLPLASPQSLPPTGPQSLPLTGPQSLPLTGPQSLPLAGLQSLPPAGTQSLPPVCSVGVAQQGPSAGATMVENNTADTSVVPSPALTATASGSAPESADSSLNKPAKKTVYLKKYNYLRSQKALEEMYAESLIEPVLLCCPSSRETHQEEPPAQSQEPEVPATGGPSQDTEEVQEEEAAVAQTQLPSPHGADHEEDNPKSTPDAPKQTGHKQYCCGVCGKIFKHPSNLELHKRSHTGIHTPLCDFNDTGFQRNVTTAGHAKNKWQKCVKEQYIHCFYFLYR